MEPTFIGKDMRETDHNRSTTVWDESYENGVAESRQVPKRLSLEPLPVHQRVQTWIILLPLLYYVTDTQPSLLSSSNSALMTTSGALIRTAQPIRPQVVIYVIFMTLLIFFGSREIWRVATKSKLILLGVLFSALSALWSVSPLLSLRTSVDLTMSTLFAFYLCEKFSTEDLMKVLMLTGVVAAALSFILVIVLPAYGIYHRDGSGAWQGIFSHKNSLGVGMAFLLTPIFFCKERFVFKAGYSAVLLFLIVMSQSRGAWFVTIGLIFFAAWLAVFRRLKGREAFLLNAVTIVVVSVTVAFGVIHLDPLMRMVGKDPTLTGRTEIYVAVLEAIFKHPLLGYGAGAFWLPVNPESLNIALSINWLGIGYAENGFLELWLGIGTLGLSLVLLMFGRAIRQAAKLTRPNYYNPRVGWFISIIVLELLTNIMGGIVMAPGNLNWLLTLIAFVGLANEIRAIRVAQADARPALRNIIVLTSSDNQITINQTPS